MKEQINKVVVYGKSNILQKIRFYSYWLVNRENKVYIPIDIKK